MNEEERAAWDNYFYTVAGWMHHPGYYRENATKLTLEESAIIADQMLAVRRSRFPVTI
jgi:hypothetical protein